MRAPATLGVLALVASAAASAVAAPVAPVKSRVGTEYAAHLLHSSDPEERIRGVQRAAAVGTPEAVALLAAAAESGSAVRADSRATIELVRALAGLTAQERARSALVTLVSASAGGGVAAVRLPEDGDPAPRVELAREIAAVALARSGDARAAEQLFGAARSGGAGQAAAVLALTETPPREAGVFGTPGGSTNEAVVRMLGRLGDLRALDVLNAATKSTNIKIRCAALVALGELGDARGIAAARTAIREDNMDLRDAAGQALVLLAAPERFEATAALIADDPTALIGIKLAERVYHTEITKLLARRALDDGRLEVRFAAIAALGRSPDVEAARTLVLPKLLGDPALGYRAALALARSPAANAGDLVAQVAAAPPTRGLGVRAYVVRALASGERRREVDAVLTALSGSAVAKERALGAFARVALGDESAEIFLEDKEPSVRRAAATATLARPAKDARDALLARLAREADAATRQALSVALRDGDAGIPTNALVDRAEAGGPDAPLAALALTRRARTGDGALAAKVGQLLASKDPVMRTHVARGLGDAPLDDASGRLATAYAYETDARVRLAVVVALASRARDASATARRDTLALAAALDPDAGVRLAARRGAPFAAPVTLETAWIRVTTVSGQPPTGEPFAASLVRSDGLAVPFVFDEDGFALVPGVPPGDATLVLAPRVPSYEAPRP